MIFCGDYVMTREGFVGQVTDSCWDGTKDETLAVTTSAGVIYAKEADLIPVSAR